MKKEKVKVEPEFGEGYAKCPKCKGNYYHKYISSVSKCNICGYDEKKKDQLEILKGGKNERINE